MNRLARPFDPTAQAPAHHVGRVVIINDASVARGGATGLSIELVRQLRARDMPVTFVCGDAGDNPELVALGVTVVALGRARLTSAGASAAVTGLHNRAAAEMLRKHIAAHDTADTAYHVHGWAQILSPAIFGPLAEVADRTLIHAHDFFLACPNGAYTNYKRRTTCPLTPLSARCVTTHCDKRNYPQKLWRVARQAALKRALGRADDWFGIAMIHPAMAPLLARAGHPSDQLTVVRNPVAAFTATRIKAEDNDRFVFIGRIEPDKGVRELAAAARTAQVPLTMVGEGPLAEELQGYYPEITFTGWQNRDGIAATVQSARAVVMASISPEPFGLVAAEASLSGLPVVISETALLAPEFAQNGLGLVAKPDDPADFARVLATMRDMSAPALREISETAFSGRAGVAQTQAAWTDQLLSLYAKAVG